MTGPAARAARRPARKEAPSSQTAGRSPAAVPKPVPVGYDNSVFVNCPFDKDYLPLLHAMLFAIHDCGFVARTALEETGAREQRIAKICRLLEASRLSIHDISRTTLSLRRYPRMNMPFECGIAYGLHVFSGDSDRNLLVMEAEAYSGQKTLSDLAGTDPKHHENKPEKVVNAVRAFLALNRTDGARTRGATAIWGRYELFKRQLPTVAHTLELSVSEIKSLECINDWLQAMSAWVLTN